MKIAAGIILLCGIIVGLFATPGLGQGFGPATRPSQNPDTTRVRAAALKAYLHQVGGIGSSEDMEISAIRCGLNVPEFAKSGDLIWEVRVVDVGPGFGSVAKSVKGILWVNNANVVKVLVAPNNLDATQPDSPKSVTTHPKNN